MSFRLQFRRYQLPFRSPVRTAHGIWATREGVIVRLEDEAGRAGFGEAAPIPEFGTESLDEIEAGCRALGGAVDEHTAAAVPGQLGCLRSALAAARDDVARQREPDVQFEGLAEDRRYAAIAALLPAGKPALARIAPLAEGGFRVFKWKVGVADISDELALLDDVCAALPAGAKLRLDANGAWDRRRAERWLERCAERPVEFVEQPCLAQSSAGASAVSRTEDLLRGLAEDFPTPIALDESLVGEGDIARWLAAGWPDIFVVKPALLGNAATALDQLAAAKAQVVFSSALETAIGARSALRIAFRWPGEWRALGFGVWPLFADSRFDGPHLAPFIRREDVEQMSPDAIWNALS